MDFARRTLHEGVEQFHHRPIDSTGRELWVPVLTETPTLVLGSSQKNSSIDLGRCERAGIAVVRRRTGGGAVLVSADDLIWFDLVIDRDDPLWINDVGRAFEWVGDACTRALATLGVDTTMHTGALHTTTHSPAVCFAGLGSGELTLDGRKLVGVSQRRTRTHARFQVAVLRRWDGAAHADLLALPDAERIHIGTELDALATGIDIEPGTMIDALHEALPD